MNFRPYLSQIALVVGAVLLSIGIQAFAFTQPATSPPNGDAYAPLDTSANAQAKVSGLLLNTGGATNGLIVQYGNVGIGTVSPNTPLHIYSATSNDGLRIQSAGTNSYARMWFQTDAANSWNIGERNDGTQAGGFSFESNGTGPWTSKLFITPVGNVGIGTNSPAQLLTVGSPGSAANAFYTIGASTIGVGSSLYSYGYICVGNSSGTCTGTGGTVMSGTGIKFPDGSIQTSAAAVSGGSPTFANTYVSNGGTFQLNSYNNNGYFAMDNASTYWGIMGNYAANDWRIGWGNPTGLVGWNLRWDNTGTVWTNGPLYAGGVVEGTGFQGAGTLMGWPGYNGFVENNGSYVWPGTNDGSLGWNQTYYLASNASYGLYTNTGLYAAGSLYTSGSTYVSGTIYDWANTGYYVKPSGTSYMNNIETPNGFYATGALDLMGWSGYNGFVGYAGQYMWPGFLSGQGSGWNQSYYLAGSTSWGLYTNTSLDAAGGLYDQGNRVYSAVNVPPLSCTTVTTYGGSGVATSYCAGGYTLTGGGCSGAACNGIPNSSNNSYYCSVTGSIAGIDAYAVCCKN